MDIKQALETLKRSKVSLGDEANEALDVMCNYVHDILHESEIVQVCFHCWEKSASIDDELCVECRKAHDEAPQNGRLNLTKKLSSKATLIYFKGIEFDTFKK